MGDRNEYMREYMRARRAKAKAEGQAASIESTEPGQVLTEPGIYERYKWAWWLVAGIVVGMLAYAVIHTAKHGTPEERAVLVDALTEESTEPVNTEESAEESTEPGQE